MGFKSDKPRGGCPSCKVRFDLIDDLVPIHKIKVKVNKKMEHQECPGSEKRPVNPVWPKKN